MKYTNATYKFIKVYLPLNILKRNEITIYEGSKSKTSINARSKIPR